MSSTDRSGLWVALAYAYVVAVLGIDTLVTHRADFVIDWSMLRADVHGIDVFKFVAWFVLPFLVCLPRIDWGYFTFTRWKRIDWIILASVASVGGLVMFLLPHIPQVGEYYRGWADRPMDQRIDFATRQVLWTLSWLTGWEFMHRYLLPRTARAAWPVAGWQMLLVTVPLIEGLYHVVQRKPPVECVGVALMSAVFTFWVVRRRNALLPFLGHLIIELELILYLFFTD